MRRSTAETYWRGSEGVDLQDIDRVPGTPLLGFLSGTLISLALWVLITWLAFQLLA